MTPAAPGTARRGYRLAAVRSLLCLDSLIVAFASWTIGFRIALAMGLGWVSSLGLDIAVGRLCSSSRGAGP